MVDKNVTNRDFISQNYIFRSMRDEIIDDINSFITEEEYKKGDIIITQGNIGDSFYIIKSGHVEVFRKDENSNELIMSKLGPGDCFGERSLLYEEPRSANIRAMDELKALTIPKENFSKLLEKYDELLIQMCKVLETRVSLLEQTDIQDVKDKFKDSGNIKIDLPLLELLNKFNYAAGGNEQINHCKETAMIASEMARILCPMAADKVVLGAYLHEIGKISLSETLVKKERNGLDLTDEEKQEFSRIYEIALKILEPYKNLRESVDFIRYLDIADWRKMPIEAQILKVASDYQKMIEPTYQNLFKDKALDTIIEKSDRDYNFQVVQALKITIEKFSLMAVEEQINFIRCMNIALDCKDNHYTMDHCRDTGMMAKKIAERMEIQKDEMDTLLLASELHDVGKIHIKAEILNAPRKLTSEEFEIMMKHAQWSSLFFQEIPGMERISDIIKHHHEKCNGTGYPDNLKSENIPYLSKILTVADIYSALTTPRIYRIDTEGKRESKSLKETLSIMDAMNLQGDFDPEIYKVFSQIINEKISGNNESVKQIN